MPREIVEDNLRIALRVSAKDEARRVRARVKLSERDSLRVLELLSCPPPPNAKLLSAARRMPRQD